MKAKSRDSYVIPGRRLLKLGLVRSVASRKLGEGEAR
jgi:hypothetical protein